MNIIVPSMIILYFHMKINRNRTFVRFVAREVLFYQRTSICTYVYEYVCMSIFELAYLTNYDYWSNIVRSLSVVKYRFFSRDLLYARATVFFMIQYIIYFFFIIYTSFHLFLFTRYTQSEALQQVILIKSALHNSYSDCLIGKAILIRIFLFVLLGKASNCSKRVLDD